MKHHFSSSSTAVFLLAACMIFLASGSAMGAGFALIEQSASGLGNAYAGGAASAEDASTVFFNPAGMTRLNGTQFTAAGHLVMPSAKFNNEGSTHVLQGVTGAPLLGGNGGDGGVTKFIPNFYVTKKVGDRLVLGLGVNAPFGLATDYDGTWVGRYHAIESDMLTVNINPSVAYRINEYFSIGAGISAQYIKAKLSNAIDFGTLDALGAFKALGLSAGALHLTPQGADGLVRLEGDDWGVGYNLGLLFEFTPNTRAGVAYRSRIRYTLKGDAEFTNTPAGLNPYPVFKNSGIEASITVPDTVSVSVSHAFNPQWAVMADLTWTNWKVFNELRVRFNNPAQADSVTTTNWRDSYRYSLGATYTPNPTWKFRAGVAYDETPIADEQHRTPRIPDGDRIWTALGASYTFSKTVSVDLGYAHLFINNPKIFKTPTGEDAVRGGLRGTYDAHVDIVSAQVNVRF
jgi:long-chain fatty acid transport protein